MCNKTIEMNTIKIGLKELDLTEMVNNGVYEIESGIEVDTFVLNEFEFVFSTSYEWVGTEHNDLFQTETKIYERILNELIEVNNLDTDKEITLTDQEKNLILNIARTK